MKTLATTPTIPITFINKRTTMLHRRLLLSLLVGSVAAAAETPTLRLAHVFSDQAVIQRDHPLPVWGWAAPGATVTVALAGQKQTATAGADGRWQVTFTAVKAGNAALELTASSGSATASAKNLVAGDVWLCGGQTNMAIPLGAGVATASPKLRLLRVAERIAEQPQADIGDSWAACNPQSAAGFSAIAYHFATTVQQDSDVPIGLIQVTGSNSQAQAWIAYGALNAVPETAFFARQFTEAIGRYPAASAEYAAKVAAMRPGWSVSDADWEKPGRNLAEWKEENMPKTFEQFEFAVRDGTVWFLRTIDLPAGAVGKDLIVSLGAMDDGDAAYWDGELIGYTNNCNDERKYPVPAAKATAGKHLIASKITDAGGNGGMTGKPEQMALLVAGSPVMSLAGPWHYRMSEERPTRPPEKPMGPTDPNLPTGYRNGMIAPLAPYALRGVLWYQDATHAALAAQYRSLLPVQIADWRTAWGQADLPFVMVQTPNTGLGSAKPEDSDWAELRDAQAKALSTVPGSKLAATIDLGEADSTRMRQVAEVGRRLAALTKAEGQSSGPVFTKATVEGARLRVRFDQAAGGLVAGNGVPLRLFSIAGEDKKFVWAEAVIDGDSVLVSSAAVPKPVAVRYAWMNNPVNANLTNKTGVPALPFRSDSWQR